MHASIGMDLIIAEVHSLHGKLPGNFTWGNYGKTWDNYTTVLYEFGGSPDLYPYDSFLGGTRLRGQLLLV